VKGLVTITRTPGGKLRRWTCLSDDGLQTYVPEGEAQTMHTTTSTENPRTQQGEVRCR
jgi:hypothetical protein